MKVRKKSTGELMEMGGDQIAYCAHCGRHINTVYFQGELVLISVPGTRPHYGVILKVEKGQEGPQVILDIGGNETETCHLDYLEKVN